MRKGAIAGIVAFLIATFGSSYVLFHRTEALGEIMHDANRMASDDDADGYALREEADEFAVAHPGFMTAVALSEASSCMISFGVFHLAVVLVAGGLGEQWRGWRDYAVRASEAGVVPALGAVVTTAARLSSERFFTIFSPLYYMPVHGLTPGAAMLARSELFSMCYLFLAAGACSKGFALGKWEGRAAVLAIWVVLGVSASLIGVPFRFLL